ncbi:MAG: hypothetical protein NT040_14400 [Bacteroidetes bacterium]|nr:hypothetical protein [Bacteroidota bacterium]
MRYLRFMPLFLLLLPVLFSCNKDLKVNADWKDVTVVYGLLDQSDTITYIKITKAFLGEGNALQFAKVPDSSIYPDKLEVRMDEYLLTGADTTFRKSYPCDTVTIHNKEAGDSIFYYPDQLMYFARTLGKLSDSCVYKLFIKNRKTGKEVTAQTGLVRDFELLRPNGNASFPPGQSFNVRWKSVKNSNGKRYQLVIRFIYRETLKSNLTVRSTKYIDWMLFNDVKPVIVANSQLFDLYYPANAFYTVVGSKIKPDSLVTRVAYKCIFFFTVAADDLNTYMEVTEPSLSLVQEKPAFTNINNGIGLFSSRFMKPRFPSESDSMDVSQITIDSLRINAHTKNLGF